MAETKRTQKKEMKLKEDSPKNISEELSASFDPYAIIKSSLSTEKAIRNIEFDNKLSFIVSPHATKAEVKKAVEILFKVKVVKVNVQNSIQGQKRAYVRLGKGSLASDVSAELGLI